MSVQTETVTTRLFGKDVSMSFGGPWAAYWMVFVRLIAGWWFLHAGLDKIMENGVMYDAGWWLSGAEGTAVGPITSWFAANAPWLVNFMIPWGQLAIGLGLIFGVLTRLAAANGAILMTFFWLGNAEWAHGMAGGELNGLLVFMTVVVLGGGSIWGIDAYLRETEFAKNNRWFRYLLG
jgi:thiosulfate dehydrogenase [quinone] large subunit